MIGETERAQSAKAARADLPPFSRDEWIETHLRGFGAEVVKAAHTYIAMVEGAGGHAEVTKAQGSMIAVFDLAQDTIYPMTLSRYGKGSVQLCLSYLVSRPAFASDDVRKELLERLVAIVGPLSTSTLNGFPGFPATKLNEPAIAEQIENFLRDISAKATEHAA